MEGRGERRGQGDLSTETLDFDMLLNTFSRIEKITEN